MKLYLIALALVATLALVMTGCTQGTEDEMVTGKATGTNGASLSLAPASEDNVVRDYEVLLRKERAEHNDCDETDRDKEDCEDKAIAFFPQTFAANVGDVVKLVFLFEEPHFISIDGLGIAEEVQYDTLEFMPEEAGNYDVICMDCENNPIALVVIN